MRTPQVVADSGVDKMSFSGSKVVSMYILFLRTKMERCCWDCRRRVASSASKIFLVMVEGEDGREVNIRTSFV